MCKKAFKHLFAPLNLQVFFLISCIMHPFFYIKRTDSIKTSRNVNVSLIKIEKYKQSKPTSYSRHYKYRLSIYLAQPGLLEIETSDPLEEGDQGHITCRSKGGRPPPQLEMLIDGSVLPSTALQVIDSDQAIRLSPVERDWHGKTLTCRYWNEFYNDTAIKLLDINGKNLLISKYMHVCKLLKIDKDS